MTERESLAAYRRLAEFRHQIRQFLHVSEQAARAHAVEPRQHQVMLALKGLPEGAKPTVTTLAHRLCLKHHSVVELVNRLVERRIAVRRRCQEDRRQVLVELTAKGEAILEELKNLHCREIETTSVELCLALQAIVDAPSAEVGKASERR
jgi:DNA-binding MarR family transcriptional regulator